MTLAWIGQEEFSAGMLRASARGAEAGVGVITARNGLFDDDGDVYRRAGDSYASNAADGPLTFMWSGYLNNTPRTIVASATKTYSMAAGVLTQIAATGIARPILGAVVGDKLWLPGGKSWDGGGAIAAWTSHDHVAACADRLVVADSNVIRFSKAGNPADFSDPTDFHKLPDGVLVVGMLAIRDSLLVFTNYGLWSITGMSFDLTDALGNVQQTLSRITPELSLLHAAGLCEWAGKIVAPCTDRVFLVDTISQPIAISDSISPFYMRFVRAGFKPGGAKAFRNHLFLPMLAADNTVAATLVCRLNRPVRGRFVYYPWSAFDGHAGNATYFDVSMLEAAPKLLSANRDGRVCDLTNIFNPSAAGGSDADGTAQTFELETRDYPTGSGQPNHIKRLRLYYTLEGEGTIEAAFSVGSLTQTYEALAGSGTYQDVLADYGTYDSAFRGGASSAVTTPDDPDRWWQGLPSQSAESAGIDPFNWNLDRAKRARFVRAWFRCESPVEKLVIHRIEFGVRPATHTR